MFIVPSRRRNSGGCPFPSRVPGSIKDARRHIRHKLVLWGEHGRSLLKSLPKGFLQQSTLITPQDDRRLEDSMTEVLATKTGAILIDDLNAFHYLLSSDRLQSGTQRLFAFIRLLSYEARINDLFVFGTVYKAEGDSAADRATKRSLSAAADLQVSTEVRIGPSHVQVRRDKGLAEQQVQHATLLRPEHVDSHVDRDGDQEQADRKEEVDHPRLRRLPSAEV